MARKYGPKKYQVMKTYGQSEKPLVSVVVPTFNRAASIDRALNSVITQTYDNWELIVVDDGSQDQTPSILSKYSENPRITLLRQENRGQSAARNVGVSYAKGKYLAFLDSDDEWLPTKLSQQILIAEQNDDYGVFYCDEIWVDNNSGLELPQPDITRHSGKIAKDLITSNFVSFTSSLVRKDLFDDCGGFDESMRGGEDYDLWLRLSLNCRFLYSPFLGTRYSIAGNRITDNFEVVFGANKRALEKLFRDNSHEFGWVDRRRALAQLLARRGQYRLGAGKRTVALQDFILSIIMLPTLVGLKGLAKWVIKIR